MRGRPTCRGSRSRPTSSHAAPAPFRWIAPWGFGKELLDADARRLELRRPLLDLFLLEGAEGLGRLPLARHDVQAQLREARADRGIGERLDHRTVEPRDRVPGRALGR